ncbi:MAG: hypothetical protein H7070_06810 [Saprospiraceae bacterium]|nr:hypothetical protein [Pyrinomonadaceae bacterium]
MPEKPKPETDDRESPCETPEKADESSWGKDIEEKDYYYDDAHGYEVFVPGDESEDDQ